MILMRQKYGLAVAVLVLVATLLVSTPPELSTAGHRMLAVLLFSVIVWMSESVSYPVSASIIMTLMAFLLGTAPDMINPTKMLGTSGALKLALSGFSSTALALVGAALFIAAAMMKTGLDKRIALFVLSKIGARTNRILAGVILVGFILPVNAPQNMVAFSTETFEARTFVKTGIPLTIIAFAVIMLMSVTYWSWIGVI